MKKIFNILLSATALLAFAPFMNGQTYGEYSINGQIKDPKTGAILEWPKDNGVHKETDFAYSKDISSPQSDGTYWIKLESFSTGHASYVESAAPADIVLVLDFSNSMSAQYSTTATYLPINDNSHTWNDLVGGTRYIKYQGEYRQIFTDRLKNAQGQNIQFGNGGGYGWAYFTIGTTTYYLDGDQIRTGDHPVWSGSFGTSSVLWTGILYEIDNSVTRLEALKAAVSDFVDVIYHNDNYESAYPDTSTPRTTPLENRISVVIFSADNANDSRVLVDWTYVTKNRETTREMDDSIIRAVTSETDLPRGTYSNRGMNLANTQLGKIDAARKLISTRTVVLFTDGVPGGYTEWNEQYQSTQTANGCILAAKTAKNDHGATVFTVALYTWPASSSSYTQAQRNMRNYLNYTSSNYQNAESLSSPGTGTYDGSYFKLAGNDLAAVFREIAHQSGGSSTTLSAASSNVDVVSNSFILPEGANADNIQDYVKIFVAKLQKMEVGGKYVFYEEYLKGHTPDQPVNDREDYYYYPLDEDGEIDGPLTKVDATIDVSLDSKDDHRIKVTGFDYSSMFCGPVYREGYTPSESGTTAQDLANVDHYQGYKIIIMIPIKMNPDAVGGPDVETNAPGSGIYISDEDQTAFVPYESPVVSLPVNIHITKSGLKPGESAKFRIERANLPESGPVVYDDLIWNYVTTVFVTQPQNAKETDPDPIVYVRGLPANQDVKIGEGDDATTEHRSFVYRISEENWSWSYDFNAEPKYTDTDYIDNPFEFVNTPKDNIDVKVRHAESKATNKFKTGETHGNYDDSKKNTGVGRGE